MNLPPELFIQSLTQAQQYLQQGQSSKALALCKSLLAQGENDEVVLKALIQIYFSINEIELAIVYLKKLACLNNGNLNYCQQLTRVCRRYNKLTEALTAYEFYIDRNPKNPIGYYNYAGLLKENKQIEKSIHYYQQAIDLNIDSPEEVWVNIATIYQENHQITLALEKLDIALTLNPKCTSAMINKAAIFEGMGKLEPAKTLYESVCLLEPESVIPLSRLAYCKSYRNDKSNAIKIIDNAKHLIATMALTNIEKESLNYALGKIHDDISEYAPAFEYYQRANLLSQTRTSKYIPQEVEAKFTLIKAQYTKEWFNGLSITNREEPLFIVGMFRSGSTLLEQILASHPSIVAGGELNYFPELAKQINFGQGDQLLNKDNIAEFAQRYLTLISKVSADKKVTDKRPDNFLYIGLIKTIFPKAKFIWTLRDKEDNALSNYFLQLDASMNYVNSLPDFRHYYDQHKALLKHWLSVFPEDIYTVNYDDLIINMESEITPVLSFIGCDWVEECEFFHQLNNHVQTASVWQVRQPLYKTSSGRAKNYRSFMG